MDLDKHGRTETEYLYSGTFGDDDSIAVNIHVNYPKAKRRKRGKRETLPDAYEEVDTTDWEAEEKESKGGDDADDVDGEAEPIDVTSDFASFHTVIKHENKRYRLIRNERAARTEEDFEKLVVEYDTVDKNREQRERRYEKVSTELLRDFRIRGHQTIFPAPLGHTWWRELLRGDFNNVIHDCPYDIQEFFGSRILYDLLSNLKDTQKEVLYYRAIRYWSNQQIAAMRGQTDRNILKTYETLIESLRYKLYMRLLPRYKAGFPLTLNQRRFMDENKDKYGDGKPKRQRRTKAEIEKAAIESGINK